MEGLSVMEEGMARMDAVMYTDHRQYTCKGLVSECRARLVVASSRRLLTFTPR
jgi:hypothetical protein